MWFREGGHHPAGAARRGGARRGFGLLKGWVISVVGWVWMRVAVRLGYGEGEGQGEGQGVVGMRKTEMPVCRRMRKWSPNMIICKGIVEVGRKYIKRDGNTYVVCWIKAFQFPCHGDVGSEIPYIDMHLLIQQDHAISRNRM